MFLLVVLVLLAKLCLQASFTLGAPVLEEPMLADLGQWGESVTNIQQLKEHTDTRKGHAGPAAKTFLWEGPAAKTIPSEKSVAETLPWPEILANSKSFEIPLNNTRPFGNIEGILPWKGQAQNSVQQTGQTLQPQAWGNNKFETWGQPIMKNQYLLDQPGQMQPGFFASRETKYGSASFPPHGNIKVLPPVHPNVLSHQPPHPYQGKQGLAWSRSFSPLPGNRNCYNQCNNRCGSYQTYPGCRPTCGSRCNIRPSCPGMSGDSYMYAGKNTLLCGHKKQTSPSWARQSNVHQFNPGYARYPMQAARYYQF